MRFYKKIPENVIEVLKGIPMFKRVLDRTSNGDVVEKVEEMTFEEKKAHSIIAGSPDAFSNSVQSVPDTMYIDKFTAIDRLNAAIAGINPKSLNTNVEKE